MGEKGELCLINKATYIMSSNFAKWQIQLCKEEMHGPISFSFETAKNVRSPVCNKSGPTVQPSLD